MMRDVIRHSVVSHPSSPKTLPPTTIGFGGTGTDAPLPNQIEDAIHSYYFFYNPHCLW